MNDINNYTLYQNLINCTDLMQDTLRYYLIKSNLEFLLEEYSLCRESFKEALQHLNFCDNTDDTLESLMLLASVCCEWTPLLKEIRKNEDWFLNKNYSSKLLSNFKEFYCALFNEKIIDFKSILEDCVDCKEKSIFLFLQSMLLDDDALKHEYCKVALGLWNNNLAAAEYLFKCNQQLDSTLISKLFAMNKIDPIKREKNVSPEMSLDFDFLPLGGGNDIGASSYYLRIKDFKAIIDAGVKINSNKLEYPNFELLEQMQLLQDVEYVFITHAHLDHCGAIVNLWRKNKKLKFVMTRETKELLRLNLRSQKISQEDLCELENLMLRIILLNFNEEFTIPSKGVKIQLYQAGHILGAASILIKSTNCNVFVTGDFCLRDQKTVRGLQLPCNERIDVLITESTYGDKHIKSSYRHEYAVMQEFIKNSISQGKRILIPSFSIGRAQEVLNLINEIDTKEKIRVYIDGSAIKATKLYEHFSKELIFKKGNYYVNDEFYLSKQDFIKQEILTNKCCVISSSGMLLEGSASCEYSKLMLSDENSVCILTGYQAFNTVGARLKEQMRFTGERYISIEGVQYDIKAELKSFNLSAHSNIDEITAVQLYLQAKNVILVHGDYKGKSTLLEDTLNKFTSAHIYQSSNDNLINL